MSFSVLMSSFVAWNSNSTTSHRAQAIAHPWTFIRMMAVPGATTIKTTKIGSSSLYGKSCFVRMQSIYFGASLIWCLKHFFFYRRAPSILAQECRFIAVQSLFSIVNNLSPRSKHSRQPHSLTHSSVHHSLALLIAFLIFEGTRSGWLPDNLCRTLCSQGHMNDC